MKLYHYAPKENTIAKDGLVEEIWCKDGSDSNGFNERFNKVEAYEIDTTPLTWEKCNSSKGLLYAVVKHYLILLKNGVIPAKYLKKE